MSLRLKPIVFAASDALNFLDTCHQILDKTTLVYTTIRACRYDAGKQLNWIMLANYQNLGLPHFFPEMSRRFQPTHPWHAYVEQDQVGQKFPSFLQCLRSILGFPADFQILLRGQDSAHTTANNVAIIGDENSHTADLRKKLIRQP